MMAQCEYLLGRLKDARAHYQRLRDQIPSGEFVGAGARPGREHRQAAEHVRDQHRPRRGDGAHLAPRRADRQRDRDGPGAQQLLGPARPLPDRRHQGEPPGADAHRRHRHRRDQAAVLQAGPDPGAAGDRDHSAGRDAVHQRQPRPEPVPPGHRARARRDLRRGDRPRCTRRSS